MSDGLYRRTDSPQRVHNDRANSEWRSKSGLENLVHGADRPGSQVDRSAKAAPLPEVDFHDHLASGDGSRGIKGWTGDGKGAPNPEEYVPKRLHKEGIL
ncbi:hypothetical protein BKA64DRAFT_32201 [Cadophora sp. MPI-SDFR-AT-0126]|nr:hypothetical protein BKA64DRAFT_32201 [Leotiomycetes sp. MPI-SDFR-AT-0126]